ncbi:MAG: pseudouridine-5'-phosphate glycosidase [Oscillospiraceae bacterium]|nr:pseudouridine-5'-phosphate glycosidase [Oscillospiraceae bacterium]
MNNYLKISNEVQAALAEGRPVVALESTIISHGFPYPQNLECARRCEQIIREAGAVPATIAIIDGWIKVGLTEGELVRLAETREMAKCSRRDVAAILSRGGSGATTVAGTMLFAAMAGIRVFATGGIGGVHRGAQQTFDISADLEELAQTPVAVVSAGVKSILDIPLTREYLETAGVPVIGYDTDEFPNFYTRTSGIRVDYNLETTREIAKLIHTSHVLGLRGGILICNPIPPEYALDPAYIDEKIEAAIAEAQAQGISGKATTPFLLGKLYEITGGKSIEANRALVFNNAKVAAGIAVDLAGWNKITSFSS